MDSLKFFINYHGVDDIFEHEGRVWLRGQLGSEHLSEIDSLFEKQSSGIGARFHPENALGLDGLIQQFMRGAKSVRFVGFNKSAKQNWSLPWHQDRVIAVDTRAELAGFSNWSRKSGIWHCEPPIKLLAKMVFARVYLDDVDSSNGSLELALGSHKFGKVLSGHVEQVTKLCDVESCEARRGDILLVKALTLHRSKKALSDAPRRVMRIDYASEQLPPPLKWKYNQI